jgi:hypothetical protein
MSEGDVIRLNRMYKCKQPMAASNNLPNQIASIAGTSEKSSTETAVEELSNNKPTQDKRNDTKAEGIFGVLIFKTFGTN